MKGFNNPMPTDMTELNEQALEKVEELHRSNTRKAAINLAPDAIAMMGKISKGHQLPGKQRPTPGTMLKACEDVLHQAHGRPETRDGRTGQAEAGLVIMVNHISTGRQEMVMGDAEVLTSGSVESAILIAEQLHQKKNE